MPPPSWLIRTNPYWTNNALFKQWDQIEARVGPALMPRLRKHTAHNLVAKEFGTGYYGTVLPSETPGMVVKITSDPSEARFAFLTHHITPPSGIVKYRDVFQLDATHSDRPVFILWREEAFDVGNAIDPDGQAADYLEEIRTYLKPTFQATQTPALRKEHLGKVMESARKYRNKTGFERGGTGPDVVTKAKLAVSGTIEKAGFGIDAAWEIASAMAHGDEGRLVGAALRDLIRDGIILADVHSGNVGDVKRKGAMRSVITDPGHAGFLTNRYDSLHVPMLDPRSKTQPYREPRTAKPYV